MTAPTWLGLGVALLLLPAADPALERIRALARRGRLEPAPNSRATSLGMSRLTALPAPLAGLVVAIPVVAGAGWPVGLAGAVVAATGWHLGRGAMHRRSARRADVALLSAVRVIEAELAAGSRPAAALGAAAAAAPGQATAFSAAARRAGTGAEADQELAAVPELVPLAHAWRLATTVGAPLAEVLGRVADDLAARAQQQRKVSSALASARSSAALLAVLPVLGVGLGSAMDADPLAFLFGSAAGQWVLLAGVVLDAAGVLWTQQLTARAERP